MKAAIIINPVSGGRARGIPPARRVEIARAALARAGVEGEIWLTERAGHATALARQGVEAGCAVVVAWGGDGTINEVASVLVHSGVPLGIVRAGSGNGFARELGVPTRPDEALAAALTGEDRAIDAGEIGGRFFLNVAGIGFDAAMAYEFNRLGSERRGAVRYTASVFRSVFAYQPADYLIEVDGERLERSALLLAIANLPQYGANAVIAPGAVPFDGLLDLVIIEGRGALGRIGLVPRLFDRTIHKAPGVLVRRARRVVVTTALPAVFHVDGEPVEPESRASAHGQEAHARHRAAPGVASRLEARVLPGALTLRGIPGRRWAAFFGGSTAGILSP